jgi:SAM-dependent methyltransferase
MSQLSRFLRARFSTFFVEKKVDLKSDKKIESKELQECMRLLESQCERLVALEATCQMLSEELFHVPSLPEIRFLDLPLGERFHQAKYEMKEFLGEEQVSEEEYAYLCMQLVFRGSSESVSRQLAFVIDSMEVSQETRSLPIVDIGCGRGEMLQLLKSRGFKTLGVDTNRLVVRRLKEEGFDVFESDGIAFLEAYPNDSLGGVTAFHVIEHLDHDYFRRLTRLAFEKTAPGGFLLLETPNPFTPESLSYFYTDQTHVRPIQPFQLAFWVQYAGYVRERAHFSEPVPAGRRQSLDNWLRLYQNHGIVAYKPV